MSLTVTLYVTMSPPCPLLNTVTPQYLVLNPFGIFIYSCIGCVGGGTGTLVPMWRSGTSLRESVLHKDS